MRTTAVASEVLRGMHVENAPVRLRGHAAVARADDAARTEAGQDASLRDCFAQAAQAGREEGRRAGYEEGLREGQADAAARVQQAVDEAVRDARRSLQEEQDRVRSLLLGLARLPEECLQASEDEMIALCFDALCRILGAHAVSAAQVAAQVRHLVSLAQPGQRLALHMHPDDAQLLRDCDTQQGLAIVGDPDVVLGGAVVRSSGGSLDARLETMLDACRTTLLGARAAREHGAGGDAA